MWRAARHCRGGRRDLVIVVVVVVVVGEVESGQKISCVLKGGNFLGA